MEIPPEREPRTSEKESDSKESVNKRRETPKHLFLTLRPLSDDGKKKTSAHSSLGFGAAGANRGLFARLPLERTEVRLFGIFIAAVDG
jgi:hypothetical protein